MQPANSKLYYWNPPTKKATAERTARVSGGMRRIIRLECGHYVVRAASAKVAARYGCVNCYDPLADELPLAPRKPARK